MHKYVYLVLILATLLGVSVKEGICTEKLHPRNKVLIKHGQIPPMKYFREVPRITATEAYGLYMTSQAIFIAVGHDAPRVLGGWLLEDYMRFNPRRLKIPKKKFVLFY